MSSDDLSIATDFGKLFIKGEGRLMSISQFLVMFCSRLGREKLWVIYILKLRSINQVGGPS